MKPTITLVLTTDGVCNVACKTCPTGRREKDIGAERMSLEMVNKILDRAMKQAYVLSCCVYYFNEPYLHPQMVEILKAIGDRGLYRFVSTNLSFSQTSSQLDRVLKSLELGIENLIVSASGWTQAIYEKSHKGGNIEWLKDNMRIIASRRKPETFLRLSWHEYNYNKHESYRMEQYATELGFKFTPYGTGVLPLERVIARWNDGMTDPAETDIMVKLPVAKVLCSQRRHWNCQMQDQTVVVDYAGTVYLCGDRNSPLNWRGSFFDRSVKDILAARKTDPTCIACKAMGGHIYAAQEYTTPLFHPFRYLDLAYRKLHLQRAFQTISPKLWRRSVEGWYNRPTKKD